MKFIKRRLEELVEKFQNWLNENYTIEQIQELLTDDCSFPFWNEITELYSTLLEEKLITQLDTNDKNHLLYLIARNWDIGDMISWLSSDSIKELSNLGHLTREDFIILAKSVIKLRGNEYNDAKSQIASSFRKFDRSTIEIEYILLELYNDKDEYTKRQALLSLGKFKYENIEKLIAKSWNIINDEHHKMACLNILKDYLNNTKLLKKYVQLALTEKGKYLVEYANDINKTIKVDNTI
jgi:hypothetical protein